MSCVLVVGRGDGVFLFVVMAHPCPGCRLVVGCGRFVLTAAAVGDGGWGCVGSFVACCVHRLPGAIPADRFSGLCGWLGVGLGWWCV